MATHAQEIIESTRSTNILAFIGDAPQRLRAMHVTLSVNNSASVSRKCPTLIFSMPSKSELCSMSRARATIGY